MNDQTLKLHRKIEALERWVARTGGGLEGMLGRRGLTVHRQVPPHRLLLPHEADPNKHDRFYHLMLRYSFRLLLRDVIRLREGFRAEDLTAYCSIRAARGYLTSLDGMGIVSRGRHGTYCLAKDDVASFGETLEQFVAEVFRREFFAEAIHSVSFRTQPPGGDFDVIACMEGLLVYVEVKSSPPRGIELEEVKGFLRRREILTPHLALFLVDTHLRMRDKLAPILEECVGGSQWEVWGPLERIRRLKKEIFHANHRIYLLNSSRGIISNIRDCLMDYLRHGNPGTSV